MSKVSLICHCANSRDLLRDVRRVPDLLLIQLAPIPFDRPSCVSSRLLPTNAFFLMMRRFDDSSIEISQSE
jgi:hypothetical protein